MRLFMSVLCAATLVACSDPLPPTSQAPIVNPIPGGVPGALTLTGYVERDAEQRLSLRRDDETVLLVGHESELAALVGYEAVVTGAWMEEGVFEVTACRKSSDPAT
jgi:hypothetical protein